MCLCILLYVRMYTHCAYSKSSGAHNYDTPQSFTCYVMLGLWNYISLQHKLQETTLDAYKKTSLPLVNPRCSVPVHCSRFPTENELFLHGLLVLLSKVECCPTAHEVRGTQWNLIESYISTVLVCTALTGVHVHTILQSRSPINNTQRGLHAQLKYKSPCPM